MSNKKVQKETFGDAKSRAERYRHVYTLLKIAKIFGIVSFKIDEYEYKTSLLGRFYTLFLIVLVTPLTLYSMYARINSKDAHILFKTTDTIQLTVASIYMITIWVSSLLYQKKHIQLLSNFRDTQLKLYHLKFDVPDSKTGKRQNWRIIIRCVAVTLSIGGQIYTYTYAINLEALCFYVAFYLPFLISSFLSHIVLTYIEYIQQKFVGLNKQLTKLTEEGNRINVATVQTTRNDLELLCNVCVLHHELSKQVKAMNDIFGVSLLMMFGVSFVNTVVGLYYCSTAFQTSIIKWKYIVNNLLVTFNYAADTIFICHYADQTIEKAKESGILIHKIETEDFDMKDEIEMFSLQIANERVEFNAAGFFPINYTLVFSIIGGVTTYIIILIQLAANKTINP